MNKPTIEAAIIEANRAKNPTRAVLPSKTAYVMAPVEELEGVME